VLNEMTQKQVIQEYGQADVVFDQLGKGTIGMVSLDAMACGRPVIANARPEILEPILGVPSPVCQASTPEEVSQQIARLHFNPGERERIGLASRKYVEQHCSTVALAERCLKKLLPAH
jgi:glycosyltransferase involved in cell wall biosynthesis